MGVGLDLLRTSQMEPNFPLEVSLSPIDTEQGSSHFPAPYARDQRRLRIDRFRNQLRAGMRGSSSLGPQIKNSSLSANPSLTICARPLRHIDGFAHSKKNIMPLSSGRREALSRSNLWAPSRIWAAHRRPVEPRSDGPRKEMMRKYHVIRFVRQALADLSSP